MFSPRLLFIGCGHVTHLHSRVLKRLVPQVRRFYASRSGEKAAAFDQRLSGAGWFNSYESGLASSDIDIAFICTPPVTHAELTLSALHAGKHVIVEKPAFISTAQFDEVADVARNAGRRVLVAENYFYKPLARVLRSLVADGVVGDLRMIYVNALKWQRPAGWRADPEISGGGPLFEGGIHWVSLLAHLGPAAAGIDVFECGGPLTNVVVFHYTNGARGVLTHSWEMRSPLQGLRLSRVYGTRGSIAFESNGLAVLVAGTRKRLIFPGLRDIAGYRAMLSDFLSALEHDRDPQFSLAHARHDVALFESACYSQMEA